MYLFILCIYLILKPEVVSMTDNQGIKRTVGKVNNSLYFTIPADIVERLRLSKGERLAVSLEDGAIVARPEREATSDDDLRQIDQVIDRYMDAMKYLEDK